MPIMNIMTLIIIFTLIIFTAINVVIDGATINSDITENIIGGRAARIDEFPATVILENGYNSVTCGGTLISRKHVLTAAHCVVSGRNYDEPHLTGLKWYKVLSGNEDRFGSERLKLNHVQRIDVHKSFLQYPPFHWDTGDIAILTLDKEITVEATQRPAQLPKSDVQIGDWGTTVGWGWMRQSKGSGARHLQKASLQILNRTIRSCRDSSVSSAGICAMNREGIAFCNGDSGGPLYINQTVVGVVSNSIDCTGKTPGIFVNVFAYKKWIDEVVRGEESQDSAKLSIRK